MFVYCLSLKTSKKIIHEWFTLLFQELCHFLGIVTQLTSRKLYMHVIELYSLLSVAESARMSYKPPLNKAVKIHTKADCRVFDGNIAAIDFGTTSVSLAYTTKGDDKVNTLVLDTETQSTRIPNAILLRKNGKDMTVEAFGNIARTKFGSLRPSEYSQYVYFERIKMLLKREQVSYIQVNKPTVLL